MKGLIFTFAMSYGGGLISLFSPFVGLLVYVSFAILRPEHLWEWSVPQGGNYSRVVAIGLLAGLSQPWLGRAAAAGLALMMLVAVGTRIKIKDPLLRIIPALFYLALNAYLWVAAF